MLVLYLNNEMSQSNSRVIYEILEIIYEYTANATVVVSAFDTMLFTPEEYDEHSARMYSHKAYRLSQMVHRFRRSLL